MLVGSAFRRGAGGAGRWVRSGGRALSTAVEFDIPVEFKGHRIDTPPQKASATKEELMDYHRKMYTLRRTEIAADTEYKGRSIRGFCHLYDGQEAVAMGIQAALTNDDDWITTYRCHGAAYMRGATVQEMFEEMFGFQGGIARGKGGSMHMYTKETNFYGGAAIVGAQVPIGAGLGFYHKYKRKTPEEKTNVSLTMYGDGAANQGQCWEAANMAALWDIPVIFCCENNEYGMGTSKERSSFITEYYQQGNTIPGLFIDGMDVLAVREGFKFCKEHCASGKGPIYVEVRTYRYHGHSMSDPGITYRSRDEVNEVRQSRDPIENVKRRLVEANMATEDELKQIEKEIRKEVSDALKKAKGGSLPSPDDAFTDIYTTGKPDGSGWRGRLESEHPEEFIRMPDLANNKSFH